MLISCLVLPLFVKINAATSEANITNHSQDNNKKQFQRQLQVSSYKQTLSCHNYMEEKYFTFFLGEK